jgi:RNA polymerase sigma-70 factor (sigma-E family)
MVTGAQVAGERAPEEDFARFVAQRGPALVRFAARLTNDPYRAEDLVQEALAKTYQRWRRIRRVDRPEVYVRRLVVNAANSWWRRRSNSEVPVALPADGAADRPASGDVGTEHAERDALWALITQLPARQRAVLVLRYYEDQDDATIAEILRCSPVTVRTHARRALETLRKRGIDDD